MSHLYDFLFCLLLLIHVQLLRYKLVFKLHQSSCVSAVSLFTALASHQGSHPNLSIYDDKACVDGTTVLLLNNSFLSALL